MGPSEVEWMVEPWPRLREAGFCLPNTETVAEVRFCLVNLQQQLPKLTTPNLDISP